MSNYYEPPPQAPPPYSAYSQDTNTKESREQKFLQAIGQYEISHFFAEKLQILANFKIVFIFDDSGSMNATLSDSPLNRGLFHATRWDELQYFSKISIDLATIFNPEGVDVHFLNRHEARNIRSSEDLQPYFENRPNGYTPLSKVLNDVLVYYESINLEEKKLLVIIVTDGEPTNEKGKVDIATFRRILASRNSKTYTTIVSCTDEDETMDYLNNWDRQLPRLDVIDDYKNEKTQIQNVQGKGFAFSFGDYIAKSLIGSVYAEVDNLDETPWYYQTCSLL